MIRNPAHKQLTPVSLPAKHPISTHREVTMRLGTETGSLINYVISASKPVEPYAGQAATLCLWTDRHAYTVVNVFASGKTLLATRDKATRIDNNGQSDAQVYTFQTVEFAEREKFTLRSNGRWVKQGDSKGGCALVLGHRSEYYDHSF